MLSAKTNPARGMRDFLPSDVRKRNYVIGIIKEVYESYGFEPLETPSVENLETLVGKYGEEGNQLIFKILKRGEKLQDELTAGAIKNENELSDLALRYDLTVPLARVVANRKNDLPKFFKRYQIQPVWRADRPARGRYREFYQCDVDAIGSSSMMVEAELCAAVSEILERLGFEKFSIYLNSRKILTAILDAANVPSEKHTDALVTLDKLSKIKREGVERELLERGVTEASIKSLMSLLDEVFSGYLVTALMKENVIESQKRLTRDLIDHLREFVGNHKAGNEGLDELNSILAFIDSNKASEKILIEPFLARGLSYYTGAIFEIVLTDGDFTGSLGGGGRYDGLIGMFGKEQIPACGFSLGLERILVVMEERGMFPKDLSDSSADVMITVWSEDAIGESLKLAAELRRENLRVLVYPEADKLGKQFKYADSVKIPFVCVLGESELADNKVTLKNLLTGAQETVERDEAAAKIRNLRSQPN